MTWAQEMKNLVGDIKTSHRDRTTKISQIKGDTQNILKEADEFMKRVNAELRDMARDLKEFLAKSEDTRKKDSKAMMDEIQARIREIKQDMKDLLAKSEETRIAEFKTLMGDIKESLSGLRRRVGEVRRDAKGTIGRYKAERKEAAGYWGVLSGKRSAPAAEEEEKEEKEEEEEKEEKTPAKKKKK